MDLIPKPKKVQSQQGTFVLDNNVPIVVVGPSYHCFRVAKTLQEDINDTTGLLLEVISALKPVEGGINLAGGEKGTNEEYDLTISKTGVSITSESTRGLFWGTQTLRQVAMQGGKKLPALTISDAPDFATRGFYHDITRGKVPTLSTLKALVDTMSRYKLNQLQLYVEHTFAFRGFHDLWGDKDPLTAEEVLELDAYCRQRHVELVPSLSTFGHLYELIRLPRFQHLNELDITASELPLDLWARMAHYTLDVSQEESFGVVKNMVEQYIPLFSSKFFNICCDETFDLGKGKNKEKTAKIGATRLYVDFLKRIMDLVIQHDRIPMFWGDIILHEPTLIDEIPKEAVFLNWGYEPSITEDNTRIFAEAGVTQYVCPGVSGWSRYVNEINSASSNIRKLISYGKKWGAEGVLNTDWGDCGHVNFLANSYHGMVLAATLSWNNESHDDPSFDRSLSRLEWCDDSGRTAQLLREIAGLNLYQFSNLYAWACEIKDTHWLNEKQLVEDEPFEGLTKRYGEADRICAELSTMAAAAPRRYVQDYEEFFWGARATRWSIALVIFKKIYEYKQTGGVAPMDKDNLIREANSLRQDFARLWRVRNKDSELRNVEMIFRAAVDKIKAL